MSSPTLKLFPLLFLFMSSTVIIAVLIFALNSEGSTASAELEPIIYDSSELVNNDSSSDCSGYQIDGEKIGGPDDLLATLGTFNEVSSLERKLLWERSLLQSSVANRIIGGRNSENIVRIIQQNSHLVQYKYNSRLANTPSLQGMVVVKFAIDEFGKVLFCVIESSTMDDTEFDQEIADNIRGLEFGIIDKPDDVTEVICPFVFKQQ